MGIELSASLSHSTPMTFRLRPDSKQFIVLAAGGNPLTKIGDGLRAYSLVD